MAVRGSTPCSRRCASWRRSSGCHCPYEPPAVSTMSGFGEADGRRHALIRLASVGDIWDFAVLGASPGARAHRGRRKAAGDRNIAAQRDLFNRMIGILHHCLETRTRYDENTAFPNTDTTTPAATA